MPSRQHAFTIVEVLIVVITLGILAAIVVPQFSDASINAKESALHNNLQIVRGQVELYKLQQSTYPTLANFTTAMTTKLNDHGPYLQSIPDNPYWTGDPSRANSVGSGGAGTSAWYYNETTGEFRENHR
ncbi:MAG TPA: prepilin-type N-terminal cleavage/methylation domain-containing protein [Phycisphaerae bacterium]|nr:prepilin-type N-terminal cleavage/methylation domain-containing protein [Phycisphaerae bacterium]HRY69886.1 prepilin-type N-terminal cleavage/methylation domain-containing protein [Phycisphaerae bacterium]HSA25387.1 prepilin-type N-terminal cleavage/methylation domain-containing protein [Phycisphaerae bacterium]